MGCCHSSQTVGGLDQGALQYENEVSQTLEHRAKQENALKGQSIIHNSQYKDKVNRPIAGKFQRIKNL